MTKQPHDQLAKEYLSELLTAYGKVEISKEVTNENQEIDLLFTPFAQQTESSANLGIMSQMINKLSLFEPYRNPCTAKQIRSCLLKLYTMEAKLIRQFNQENRTFTESDSPQLWIITPTCSDKILESFGAIKHEEISGFYHCPDGYNLNIIVIHQLPKNQETLWLRILGKGSTQKRAIDELTALPPETPYRQNLLEILANWKQNLALRDDLTLDEQEDMMNLSDTYLRQREQWIQEGQEIGRQEGQEIGRQEGQEIGRQEGQEIGRVEGQEIGKNQERREMIENFFKVRFGTIDDDLKRIIPQLLKLPNEELITILLHREKSELLSLFGND